MTNFVVANIGLLVSSNGFATTATVWPRVIVLKL